MQQKIRNFLQQSFLKEKETLLKEEKIIGNKHALEAFEEVDNFFNFSTKKQKRLDGLAINALKVASLIFYGDKINSAWKKWCAFSAFLFWEFGRYGFSLQLAAIAGEWDFIKSRPKINDTNNNIDEVFTIYLLNKVGERQFFGGRYEIEEQWEFLYKNINIREGGWLFGKIMMTESSVINALRKLKKLTAEESAAAAIENLGNPKSIWPAFQIDQCAIAAIAKKRGMKLTSLDQDLQEYLFAGLNDLKSSSVYADFPKGS